MPRNEKVLGDGKLLGVIDRLKSFLGETEWDSSGQVFLKQGRDIVTAMDVYIQQKIVSMIRAVFPEHNILAEESEYEKTSSPFTWVIDPVDGTINLSRQYPVFSVSVALLYEDDPLVGIVYVPVLDKMYSAQQGRGAYCNGSRIHCGGISKLRESLISIIITSHFTVEESAKAATLIERVNLQTRGIRVMVCESAELCFIAEGILDGNISIKADPYGAMAGKLILEEAGGRFSQMDGRPFKLHSDTILASNGELHDNLVGFCAA